MDGILDNRTRQQATILRITFGWVLACSAFILGEELLGLVRHGWTSGTQLGLINTLLFLGLFWFEILPAHRAYRPVGRSLRKLEASEFAIVDAMVTRSRIVTLNADLCLSCQYFEAHQSSRPATDVEIALAKEMSRRAADLKAEARIVMRVAENSVRGWQRILDLADAGMERRLSRRMRRLWRERASLPESLTDTAARIAGGRRAYLRESWHADLAGVPEQDYVLSGAQRGRMAAGFLLAAVRMRLRDVAAPLWRPVEWVLATETRTNSVITASVGALVIYFCKSEGAHALITERWKPCAAFGAGLYGLARWLRRLRGIELAERRGPDRPGGAR